jgi:hypothetical protein
MMTSTEGKVGDRIFDTWFNKEGTIIEVDPTDSLMSYCIGLDDSYTGIWRLNSELKLLEPKKETPPEEKGKTWEEHRGLDLLCGTAADGVVGGWDYLRES